MVNNRKRGYGSEEITSVHKLISTDLLLLRCHSTIGLQVHSVRTSGRSYNISGVLPDNRDQEFA